MSSENLWKWIDAHGKEFGIGRPYLDKDPPHVAPIDGKEYADHRRGANTQHAQTGNQEAQPARRSRRSLHRETCKNRKNAKGFAKHLIRIRTPAKVKRNPVGFCH